MAVPRDSGSLHRYGDTVSEPRIGCRLSEGLPPPPELHLHRKHLGVQLGEPGGQRESSRGGFLNSSAGQKVIEIYPKTFLREEASAGQRGDLKLTHRKMTNRGFANITAC